MLEYCRPTRSRRIMREISLAVGAVSADIRPFKFFVVIRRDFSFPLTHHRIERRHAIILWQNICIVIVVTHVCRYKVISKSIETDSFTFYGTCSNQKRLLTWDTWQWYTAITVFLQVLMLANPTKPWITYFYNKRN